MKDLKQQRDKIIETFNFDRVQTAMEALKWCWEDKFSPTVARIKHTAKLLLDDVIVDVASDPDVVWCAVETGGFEARYDNGTLSLTFVVEKESCAPDFDADALFRINSRHPTEEEKAESKENVL